MQIKHTFLLTLLLGLAWTGYLFAYAFGPDPAMNGINGNSQTCATAGCHTSFPLNDPSGSVTVSGLPAAGWTAGQTYPLTVTIQRAGQIAFGFQLSSVIDATNRQAGSFKSSATVQVICGSLASNPMSCTNATAIQFAEHQMPQSGRGTAAFTVSWTAPADTSIGTIRFNVAGNAANGDVTNQGDFIFTNVFRVSPAASAPPPDLSTHAFMIVNRGGSSIITDGNGPQTSGYSLIVPDSAQTTPAGVAIFGFRNSNNVLVSETGVPASPLISSGRIYAEIAGALDTGIAIANPSQSPATVSFSFTDTTGATAGSGSTTIPAGGQLAQFLDQTSPAALKVYPGSTFRGTFSFTSDAPVGVIALRGFTNERGDFLTSTLPVIDTTGAAATDTVVVPHFADGGGWTTQLLLLNPTDNALNGNIQFTDANGAAANVTIAGATAGSFPYTVAARSAQKLATAGTGASTVSGSVRVVPAGGGAVPIALVVFSYKPAGITVTEAGVPVTSGTAFRLSVEAKGTPVQPGNIQSGIAVASASSSPAAVTFDLTDLNGSAVSGVSPVTVTLPPFGQTAKFLADIFTSLPSAFQGVLRITTTSGGISVVGLRARYNEQNDFLITTTPPSNEALPPSSATLMFPQIVNGGNYTTQFLLFSEAAGQASSGMLRFFTQAGQAFNLTVN